MDFVPKQLRDQWAPVVGNFIIEFGHIESAVKEVVRLSCLPSQFEVLRTLNFIKVADLAEAALKDWNAESFQIIKEAFSEINYIAKRRNIVAHNGFSIAVYESNDGDGMRYEIGMTAAYKAKDIFLQIKDLEQDTKSLTEIHEKIVDWIPPNRYELSKN
ncbi:hypothetical protein [Limnohabitans sp. Rim28]|jgi:hypothetical protein|uniref:hypothetical protein n=1 Tax=Limnohabitans sp. Rim28 TaxID=1100720 RepID=UPI0003610BEE|nr:hypothetical protein [Limnohabitans sp. Rim28]PVE05133.1 hypothetical protein B472_16215 [Limnohabitans sp. Rim28]